MLGELDSYMEKNETRSATFITHKNKPKMDTRLSISCNTNIALEEHTGRKISDIACNYIFTNMSARAQDIKERINKWDFIKMKSFCTAKENISNMKREQTYGKIYLPMIPQTWF